MKKFILFLLLISSNNLFAQTDTIALYQMNKVQLAKIYLEEVSKVTPALPTIPFDSSLADIPKSKYLAAKFKSVSEKIASYNKTLLQEYAEIIPYADKKDLIEAIVYIRSLSVK
jgi:hypothetical protein